MSFWSQRFNDHGLWVSVAETRRLINSLEIPEDDRNGQELLAYFGQVIELLELRRSETPSERITQRMLDQAAAAVNSWNSELANVESTAWPIQNALSGADIVQDSFASWPPLKPSRYLAGIQAAADSFVSKVGDAMERVTQLRAESEENLNGLITAQSALEQRLEEERDRLSTLISELKIAFDEASQDLLDTQKSAFDAQMDGWVERDAAREGQAEALTEELRAHEETARSTVHATTAAVVATDYGKYARNKTVAAWVCDIAGAVVGAAGVAAILFHLFTLDGNADGNVGLSITRLAASLGTLGIAALIGRRGAQHHREARAAKRTDLALRRVAPFIANLPLEERQRIVLDLTERVFIRGDLDTLEPAVEKSISSRLRGSRNTSKGTPAGS